ncbi:hypothetical protein AWB91_15725 [Mycobacterium paraense]|uniref:DUF4190 domain-containing protein n=1 Tax=Mycobacterium paraense TaxID=767916 RepID=A0A1X2A912_9MYCO|nr:DUF4190 domain-containing protein [Mycobacterium paraense]ORW31395.1 hypothetical protein AWB91_15725 [Mycobacterium paraense]ORW36398.1 hypothetical protein AWB88_24140 [Mycobacterium paraense]ORW44926.1 hypothetical protein AWB90_16055 [Mycobacterium paraense]
MAAPGGGRGDEAGPPPGGRPEQPAWQPPWEPPAADYPPDPYSPPGYQAGYPPPPGYGPPPPGYGPPAYPGYPGGSYGGPDYRVSAGTNGMAIGSLIASFAGFFCCVIGSVVAIVLGVVALNQIKQTRQEGYGLAVTGIVIGVGTLVVFLIIAMFSIHSH